MRVIWRHWKSGWSVLVRMIPFVVIVWIICLPVVAFDSFFHGSEVSIFTSEGFHWQPVVSSLLKLILFPIGLSVAQRETGHFGEQTPHPDRTAKSKPNP